jgi:hypothetical protein
MTQPTEVFFERIVTLTFLAAVLIVVARNAYGKRQWLAWRVIRFIILVLATLIVLLPAKAIGLHGWWLLYVALGLAAPVYFALEWKRSRRIPSEMRRKVIEEWEARSGKHFDPTVQELDHKIPFAKGGGHTMDNLRVVRKDANRRKAEPTLEDWFCIWGQKDE